MFYGSHTVTNKIVFKSRRWCISTGSPLMNLILGSDESSCSLRLLAIYLLYTYCLDCAALPLDEWTPPPPSVLSPLKRSTSAVALSTNSSSDKQHTTDMRDRNRRGILPLLSMSGSGCWDRRGGEGLSHLIPYPSISLFSNPAPQHRGSSRCQQILKGPRH